MLSDEQNALDHPDREPAGIARATDRHWRRPRPRPPHARILLKADNGPAGPAWTDAAISEALLASISTIERVRKRFAEQGLEAAIRRRPPRREYGRKLDGGRRPT